MWLKIYGCILWLTLSVFLERRGECNAITNAQFNASLRDYSTLEGSGNTSNVRTLQKEYERYASVAPIASKIRFKEVPDSVLAPSLGHSRGLLQGHGFGLSDYEETPQYGYEYQIQDDHGHFDDHRHYLDHHHLHYDDHKHNFGYHHKHYDHALAAKTVLWPIAGIALLGAAAALVSNPILLQLGVVSGRRKRRDADDTSDKLPVYPNIDYHRLGEKLAYDKLNNLNSNKGSEIKTKLNIPIVDNERGNPLNGALKYNRRLSRRTYPTVKTTIKTLGPSKYDTESDEKHYIPIPLQVRD